MSEKQYIVGVQTISLKLPQTLLASLDAEARRRQVTKSRVVRDALANELKPSERKRDRTCAELAQDLVGSQPGPRDSSTNKAYLKDAAFGNFRRAKPRSR